MGLPAGFELEKPAAPQSAGPLPDGFVLEGDNGAKAWHNMLGIEDLTLPGKAASLARQAITKLTGLKEPPPPNFVSKLSPEQQAMARDVMERPWGSGVPHVAYEAGGKTTDLASNLGASPETAAKLGFGVNVATQAIPALMGSYGAAKVAAPAMQGTARELMQSAMKPNVAALQKGQAERAVETALQEGISPTSGGMEKLDKIASGLNRQVEDAVANSTARVGVGEVGASLVRPYNKFAVQANPAKDTQAIKDVWAEFKANPNFGGASDMPVQLAHAMKKGTYQAIGGKAYGELGSASTEAQKALAAGLREGVARGVPEIAAPLKREASLMNLLDVAERRALMSSNNNPLPLGASIASIARDPLAAAGLYLNASTQGKALLARLLYSQSKTIPQAAGGAAGVALMAPSGQAPTDQEMLAQQLRGSR